MLTKPRFSKSMLWLAGLAMAIAAVTLQKPAPPLDGATEAVSLSLEQRERFATLINMNGKLCANVMEARRRQDSNAYYVECEERRDSVARVGYDVDLKTGKVR